MDKKVTIREQRVTVSELPDEENVPIALAGKVNSAFQHSIGRLAGVNDSYGSKTMREALMEELNALRRFAMRCIGEWVYAASDQSGRLQALDRGKKAGS